MSDLAELSRHVHEMHELMDDMDVGRKLDESKRRISALRRKFRSVLVEGTGGPDAALEVMTAIARHCRVGERTLNPIHVILQNHYTWLEWMVGATDREIDQQTVSARLQENRI